MRHFLQQLIGVLAMPLLVSALLTVAGALAHWLEMVRASRILLISGAIVAFATATPFVGNRLIGPLERRYPPVSEARLPDQVDALVVLGSGYAPRDDVPVTAALSEEGLPRIVEGIRLARTLRIKKFVVSGGAARAGQGSAVGYGLLARQLGVSESDIVQLNTPRDTAEEAKALRQILGTRPFLLVTSASHMPRAMLFMRRDGLDAIPVPTGQQTGAPGEEALLQFVPNAVGLRRTELALHEYIGLAAATLGLE